MYGDPTDDSVEWSIKFDNMSFNRVFLTNEFFTKWIYADREEIIPAAGYSGLKRTWMRSSVSPTASALSVGPQYCRNGSLHDPLIDVDSWNTKQLMLYYGNGGTSGRLVPYEAMYVFIRHEPTVEVNEACKTPSGWIC